jgi:hypothetical protein
MDLAGCGGGGSAHAVSQSPATLSGNWQFGMGEQVNPDPTKPSFSGGLQGGFLLQSGGKVTGAAIFSIATAPPGGSGGTPVQCNNGTDQISGSIAGQAVTLTASSIGAQTFSLTGNLSLDGTTMTGTYTSTDGAGCGIATAQALSWSAFLVPPLTGPIQGSFNSTSSNSNLNQQEFAVTGSLTQGDNFGVANATLSGSVSFINPATNPSDYPCLSGAILQGLISGNSVTLNIIGADGSTIGQIGNAEGAPVPAVTFSSTQNGYVLQSLSGPGYVVNSTPSCLNGDAGKICLAVNSTTGCQQPIMLTPSVLTFPAQTIGSTPTTQTIVLTNRSSYSLAVTESLTNNNGATNFTETDTCGKNGLISHGSVDLPAEESCSITISFNPQQSCAAGNPPEACLSATLTLVNAVSNSVVTVAIAGAGVPSSPALAACDFKGQKNSDGKRVEVHAISRFQGVLEDAVQDLEDHAEIE